MGALNRPGRGERARVAERVRDLLAGVEPGEADDWDGTDGDAGWDDRSRSDGPAGGWLPDRHLDFGTGGAHRAPGVGGSVGERRRAADPPVAFAGASGRLRDRLRWDAGRRGVTALAVVVLVVLAVTAWWYLGSRPKSVPLTTSGLGPAAVPATGSGLTSGSAESSGIAGPSGAGGPSEPAAPIGGPMAATSSGSPAGSATSTGAAVIVDVAGRVRRPGVYRLPSGSRIYDALRAAGGARHGVSTTALNLAAPLQDGEQIVVGARAGAVAPPGAVAEPGAAVSTGAAEVVDLNTATLEQLEALPGVGPVLGQHILDWRDAHGQFTTIDQLREVSGIGDIRFAQLHDLVTV